VNAPGPADRGPAAQIETEALRWLVEREEGFAPGRAAAFEAWCRRDPRHAASVAEFEQVFAQLDGLAERRDDVNRRLGRVSPLKPAVACDFSSARRSAVRRWRPVAWGGLAAALAAGAFFGFRETPRAPVPETRYATAGAGYERARLDDGSTLELNAASAARVRFTAAERRVELESGEAHFEVAHDTARPFVVHVGGVAVRAVGTAFNVRVASGAVEVTVTEGKIEVARVDRDALPEGAAGDPARRSRRAPPQVSLVAGERVLVPASAASSAAAAPAIERLAPAELRAVLAWQRRVADFSDTPLDEAAARFNRHHTVQLVVEDPALGARRIGGMFALDDVEAFVRLLERDGIVRAVREGDTVRLLAP
jgi:transmembrane sensor